MKDPGQKIVTMRFRVPDLGDQPGRCAAAAELASVLNDRTPPGGPITVGHPCPEAACQEAFDEVVLSERTTFRQ